MRGLSTDAEEIEAACLGGRVIRTAVSALADFSFDEFVEFMPLLTGATGSFAAFVTSRFGAWFSSHDSMSALCGRGNVHSLLSSLFMVVQLFDEILAKNSAPTKIVAICPHPTTVPRTIPPATASPCAPTPSSACTPGVSARPGGPRCGTAAPSAPRSSAWGGGGFGSAADLARFMQGVRNLGLAALRMAAGGGRSAVLGSVAAAHLLTLEARRARASPNVSRSRSCS